VVMSSTFFVLSLIALVSIFPCHAVMNRILLSAEQAGFFGARCLDGTPYGYFYEAGTQSNKWVFFFEGGGVCYSSVDCMQRAATALGSSTFFPPSYDDTTNLLSTSSSLNADYYNWNHVFIPYCSGDAHLGRITNNSTVTWGLYLSGHNNVIAMLSALRNYTNIANATEMLVSGSSAGGIAVNHHADFFAAQFMTARVVASPQAGWFQPNSITYANFTGLPSLPAGPDLFSLFNAYFDSSCVLANSGKPFDYCFSMTQLYPYITTPLFIAQNRFDEYQILINEGTPYPLNPSNTQTVAFVQYFGQRQVAALLQMKNVAKDGLFLPSCFNHTENINLDSTRIGGLSYREVLGDWHLQRNSLSHFVYDTCGSLPCNPGCLIIVPPVGSGLTSTETDPFANSVSSTGDHNHPSMWIWVGIALGVVCGVALLLAMLRKCIKSPTARGRPTPGLVEQDMIASNYVMLDDHDSQHGNTTQ